MCFTRLVDFRICKTWWKTTKAAEHCRALGPSLQDVFRSLRPWRSFWEVKHFVAAESFEWTQNSIGFMRPKYLEIFVKLRYIIRNLFSKMLFKTYIFVIFFKGVTDIHHMSMVSAILPSRSLTWNRPAGHQWINHICFAEIFTLGAAHLTKFQLMVSRKHMLVLNEVFARWWFFKFAIGLAKSYFPKFPQLNILQAPKRSKRNLQFSRKVLDGANLWMPQSRNIGIFTSSKSHPDI